MQIADLSYKLAVGECTSEIAEAALTGIVALLRRNRADEALEHFHEALQLKPDFSDAHYNLGVALSSRGKSDEAMNEFSEVLRMDPSRSDARQMLEELTRRVRH